MDKSILLTVITAVLASTGFWTFLSSAINRVTADKQLAKKVDALSDKVDENDAKLARTHILRFDDELYNGIWHSREYYRQTLQDIDVYEHYCSGHPDFSNSFAIEAIKHIRATYQKCVDNHSFDVKEAAT